MTASGTAHVALQKRWLALVSALCERLSATHGQVQERTTSDLGLVGCRETAAEQQTALHRRDAAKLQRALGTDAAPRVPLQALAAALRDFCRMRTAAITTFEVL